MCSFRKYEFEGLSKIFLEVFTLIYDLRLRDESKILSCRTELTALDLASPYKIDDIDLIESIIIIVSNLYN